MTVTDAMINLFGGENIATPLEQGIRGNIRQFTALKIHAYL